MISKKKSGPSQILLPLWNQQNHPWKSMGLEDVDVLFLVPNGLETLEFLFSNSQASQTVGPPCLGPIEFTYR